jgi:hypothetical protein
MFSTGDNIADADKGGGGGENAMEWMSARSIPRRSSTKQAQDRVSHTRNRVPWTEADARREPSWLMARHARRFSWAVIREMLVGRFW